MDEVGRKIDTYWQKPLFYFGGGGSVGLIYVNTIRVWGDIATTTYYIHQFMRQML